MIIIYNSNRMYTYNFIVKTINKIKKLIKEIQPEIKMKRASNARRGLDLSILFRSKDIDKSS